MENATKALLIAGTVLIAIIMVSTAVYLYSLYTKQTKEYNATISAVELQKFNSKFESYIGRTNIKAQEVVSTVNLSKEYDNQVQIYVGSSLLDFTSSTPEDFIKTHQDATFSCILNTSNANPNPEYAENGKIIKLKFTKN